MDAPPPPFQEQLYEFAEKMYNFGGVPIPPRPTLTQLQVQELAGDVQRAAITAGVEALVAVPENEVQFVLKRNGVAYGIYTTVADMNDAAKEAAVFDDAVNGTVTLSFYKRVVLPDGSTYILN